MGISHIKMFLFFRKMFFRKQKSRHIDSTNSGKTFHPLAQFALKLCNGLKFKHWLSVCYWPNIGLYFLGSDNMCGIKPTSKKICVSVCIQLYGKYIIYQFTIIENICLLVKNFFEKEKMVSVFTDTTMHCIVFF